MLNVIDYVPGASLLHRMNPVSKLALAASIILATFLSQSWAMLVGLLMLTLALGAYAGVITRLVSLLKVLTPIALLMLILQLAFVRGGDQVLLFATTEGLATGGRACLRLSLIHISGRSRRRRTPLPPPAQYRNVPAWRARRSPCRLRRG